MKRALSVPKIKNIGLLKRSSCFQEKLALENNELMKYL
jgi:hypothetical protein